MADSPHSVKTALVILRQPPAPWEKPGMLRDSEDLGIAYLASSLEKAGKDFVILDQAMTHLDDEEFSERIVEQGPQLIGYSDNSDQLDRVVKVARKIKERLPAVYQVIGDHGASLHADELLSGNSGVDAVCIGEGEYTLVELLQRMETGKPAEGIPGLLTRIGGRPAYSPRPKIANPSALPWPKRYVLSTHNLEVNETLSSTILGSRGCPYRCSFCGNDLYQDLSPGNPWRPRDASELVDEIEFLYQDHRVDSFTFLDELFVGPPSKKNRERLFRFCEEIRKRGFKITFRITCRADFFEPAHDRELLLALRDAGLDKIFFGIENGYPATIKLYNKGPGVTAEKMIEGVNFARDNGIFPFISFIMFHPFVSAGEILYNLDFIHAIGNSHLWATYISRLRIRPDMTLFRVVENSGLLSPGEKWGERSYAFADQGMQKVWERFNRAGQYFREIDQHLEGLLFRLFYAGDEGRKLHETIRCRVGAAYRDLGRQLIREDVRKIDFLAARQDTESLMNSGADYLNRVQS